MSRYPYECAYSIAKHYRRVVVWTFDRRTRQRVSEADRRPDPGHTRRERHQLVCEFLTELGFKLLPAYEPTPDERPAPRVAWPRHVCKLRDLP